MPRIDDLVQVPFPLPDPSLVLGNLWITQNGVDYNISPTRLGHVYQGKREPVDPYFNQLWWDTSHEEHAVLRVFEKRTHRWSAALGPILDHEGNATIPGWLDIRGGLIDGHFRRDPEHPTKYLHVVHNLRVRGGTIAGPWPGDALTFPGNVAIGGSLTVSDAVKFASTLDVAGATTLRNRLTVGGALTVGQTLHVVGPATFDDAVTFSSTAPFTINGNLTVNGSGTFNSMLHAVGPTTLDNTLTVGGATTLNSTLHVVGATQLDGTLGVGGATTLNGTLAVVGATTLNGPTQINNNLGVTGTTTLAGNTIVGGTLSVAGAANFPGGITAASSHITGNEIVDGSLNVGGALTVVGPVTFTGTVNIPSLGVITGTSLTINGPSQLNGILGVTGYSALQGGLNVSGTIPGSTNTLGVVGNAEITGNTQLDGTLNVNGYQTTNGGLRVAGVIPGSTTGIVLGVAGNAEIDGTLNVLNDIVAHANLSVENYLDVGGAATINGDLHVHGPLTWIEGNLDVTGLINGTVVSDRRLKKNIEKYERGLQSLLQFETFSFMYLDGDRRRYGLMAEDVENIVPELVLEREGVKRLDMLDTGPLMFIVINAVRELERRLAKLEERHEEPERETSH